MASKLFGGTSLSDVARSVKERAEASPFERGSAAKPVMPAAELALNPRLAPAIERESILSVDPKRVRPWKYHNRSAAWYTREKCADLIESMAKDGQQEPAVARKLVGDPKADYELIYGMRRRYAAEFLNTKLKLRVIDADDARAAVLMHIENADRQDITPMERAESFLEELEAGLFATQEAMAGALGVSKGQLAKMVKAAGLLKHPTIGALFADRTQIPVEQAYKVAALMERPGAKEVILQAAQNLKKSGGKSPREVLAALAASLDRSKKFEPVRRQYNVGAAGRLVVTRNAKGKLTLAFPQGVSGMERSEVAAAVEQVLKDMG
jgi:ParB family chromosome partitioning protein